VTANVVAEIGIKIDSSEIAKFNKNMKAANDEVVDLEKKVKSAGDEVKRSDAKFAKFASGVKTGAKVAAVGITAIAGAAAAAFAAVSKLAEQAKELENLARVARLSTQEFQALAFATDKFGLSGEQMSDILKDVDDKLGDFIATGAGPFKELFKRLPASIDLTASALAGMSGPNALIAVKKAMDEANLSTQEQRFVLEGLGNDLTKIIPLLANEGKELKKLTSEFDALNGAFSTQELLALEEYEATMRDVEAIWQKFAVTLASEVAPALTLIANLIKGTSDLNLVNGQTPEIEHLKSFEDLTVAIEEANIALNIYGATKRREEKAIADKKGTFASDDTNEENLQRAEAAIKDIENFIAATEAKITRTKQLESDKRIAEGRREKAENEKAVEDLYKRTAELREADAAKDAAVRTQKLSILRTENDAMMEELIRFHQEKQALEVAFQGVQDTYATELDLLQQQTDAKLAIIEEGLARRVVTETEAQEAIDAVNAQHVERQKDYALSEKNEKLDQARQFFSGIASLSQSGNKKLAAIGKAAAITQATISGFQAVQNALAVQPYPVGVALAVSAGVLAAGNIAKIASTPLAKGGVLDSPGIVGTVGGSPALAGEAGPEAVMPLARDSNGRLGVRGGVSVEGGINVTINGNASADDVEAGVLAAMQEVAVAEIASAQRPGNLSNPMRIQSVF